MKNNLENVMKKRKFFVIASLILILSLAVVFCACNSDTPDTPDTPNTDTVPPDDNPAFDETEFNVTYNQVEGVTFASSNPAKAKKGKSTTYKFNVSVFYEGTPVVKVNGSTKTVSYDEESGVYSFKATAASDLIVDVSGITKAESTLLSSGTGASDSPFVVKEPIDLLKMAEVINSGADNSVMSVLGYYVLNNDIDLKGEVLPIIGDGNNNYAFFGGYFNGAGHTISNFTINSNGKDYVGLFGVVQAYYEAQLGYTGGMIYNLKLSDYTINAVNSGSTVTCGSFVGQGFGASLVLCEAKNGTVNVMGDGNYFSYAGGIIGLQRSFQYPYFSKVAYCSTDNVSVLCSSGTTYAAGGISGYVYSDDPTVSSTITNCYSTGEVKGAFHAGGLVGWLSNYTSLSASYTTASVHAQSHISDSSLEQYCNSYAGGLVGMAQLDSIITDSFATGTISAHAALGDSYAHVGDIVGRTEDLEDGMYSAKEMSIYNCYYVKDGKNDTIDFTKVNTIKSTLGWHEIDWIMADGSYPVINSINSSSDEETGVQHYTYTVTLNFGGRADKYGATEYSTTISDQYEPMSFWYEVYEYSEETARQGLPESIISTDGYMSYGYFFDAECTMPVPCGYVPMRNITLYVGFANHNEVAGTYYVVPNTEITDSNNATIELILANDGTYVCNDLYGSYNGTYVYNGEYVVFDSARFARYYGEGTVASYQGYEFKAVKTAYGFDVYGGMYSDEESSEVIELVPREEPLKVVKSGGAVIGGYFYKDGENTVIYDFFANGSGILTGNGTESDFVYVVDGQNVTITVGTTSVNGVISGGVVTTINSIAVTKTDAFKGTWKILSLPNQTITFDGAGNWETLYLEYVNEDGELYEEVVDRTSGTYTVSGDKLIIAGTLEVSFSDGFVKLGDASSFAIYGRPDSYYGLWTTTDGGTVFELKGITKDGFGKAKVRFVTETNGRVHNEIYELTYVPDMLREGYISFFYEGEYYGTASYNEGKGALNASIYSLSASNMINLNLYRYDEYKGEWVSEDGTFGTVTFNGCGVYTSFNDIALNGIIKIGDQEISYRLDNFSLSGSFTYNKTLYTITYNQEYNLVVISSASSDVELVRKDVLGGKTFLDANGNEYFFDGRGDLDTYGTLTVKSDATITTYSYVTDGDGASFFVEGSKIGELTVVGEIGSRNYVLTLNGQSVTLGEKTAFTGTWALEASFENPVVIGTMNYDGVLTGRVPLAINEKPDVYDAIFTLVDDEYLVWEVENGLNLYVIKIADGLFVMSLHLNWFNYENDTDSGVWNYSYFTTADDLLGKWTNERLSQVYEFDGMGYNPEQLGMYTISNLYASSEDEDETVFYYGYFEKKDGSGYDYLVFNQYSTAAGSATKVIFKDPSESASANEYVNEAGDRAFTTEAVNLKDYYLTRD